MTRARSLDSFSAAERTRFEGRLESAARALKAIDVVGQALVDGRFDLAEANAPQLGDDGLFDDFEVLERDVWQARCRELHLVLDALGAAPKGSIVTRLGELLGRSHVRLPKTKPRFWRRAAATRFRHGSWLRLGPVVFHAERVVLKRLDADWATIDGFRAQVHVLERLSLTVPSAVAPPQRPARDSLAPPRRVVPKVVLPEASAPSPPRVDRRWRERPPHVVFKPAWRLRRRIGPIVGPLVLVAGLGALVGPLVHPLVAVLGGVVLLVLLAVVFAHLEPDDAS